MKNGLRKILGLATLGAGLLFTPIQKANAEGPYCYGDFAVNVNSVDNPMIVNYPEDSAIPYISLENNFGIGFEKDFFNFEIGLRNSIIKAGFIHTLDRDVNAMPYEGPEINSLLSPGAYAKIAYLTPKSIFDDVESAGMFLEYQADFLQEIWESEPSVHTPQLADAMSQTIKLGYESRGELNHFRFISNFFGGILFPKINQLTDFGREKELALKPSFFIGLSGTIGIGSR